MRNIFMRLQTVLLFFAVLLSGTLTARAADETSNDDRPRWYDSGSEDKSGENYHELKVSHALVGPHCMVNRVFNTVSVGTMTHNLDNLTDEDLTNAASFPSLVNVGVVYSPLVSVRDMSRVYTAGTTAGYRIVYSSGSSVLSLDLGNAFALKFFLNGKPVIDTKTQKEAAAVPATASSSVTGVGLSLIQIPGSKSMCFDVQAQAPGAFDEVELVSIKGLSANVISNIQLKYAYAGKPKTYSITKGDAKTGNDLSGGKLPNLANYAADEDRTLDPNEPISSDDLISGKVINDDLTDGKPYGWLLGLGWIGHAKVLTHPSDGKEMFRAGSTVGFKMSGLSVLSLKVGYTVVITTRDLNGNKIEEATAGSSVLGLNVASGGSSDGTVEFETKKPFSTFSVNIYGVAVNVGGNLIKYGFVKAAPTIEHHCPIHASADMNLCDGRNSAQLYHNDSIPVVWSLVSVKKIVGTETTDLSSISKVSIDQTGKVTGMDDALTSDELKQGGKIIYTFKATSTSAHCTADPKCSEEVNITRGVVQTSDLANCVQPIINTGNTKDYAFADKDHHDGGLLSISSDFKNANNILDDDKTNYATLVSGVQLANNVEIVGIKTTKDSNGNNKSFRTLLPEADQNDSIKVGFVAQIEYTGLSLDLLHGFVIRCYKGGKQVGTDKIVSQSDILGLGVAGNGDKIQKLTLAATFPPTDKDGNVLDFDEFALFSVGLAGVNFNKLDFFYPFVESGNPDKVSECENPLGCDPITISNGNTNATVLTGGATIDNNNTGQAGVVDAGSFMEDLTNIVDNDLTTSCTFGAIAKVGGGYKIAINLGRTVDYRHQLGVVMNTQDSKLLEVKAGKWMTIETYRNGKPTGDKQTEWNVLGVNLLTLNNKQQVFLMNPKKEYDEVVISLNQVADVNVDYRFTKIYGIVLQSDVDGDGVPDCKDDESCSSKVGDISTNEICQDEQLKVTFKADPSDTYYISLPEQGVDKKQVDPSSETNVSQATFTFKWPTDADMKTIGSRKVSPELLHSRICNVYILDKNGNRLGEASYYVHPLITKWRTDAADNSWDNDNNWDNGTPYLCSDVIIPSGAKKWPVLTATSTNGCNEIHFMKDAAVENVYRLNYDSAWVDLGVKSGQTLYMAPLQQTYSGDFYVIKNDTLSDYSAFKPLTETLAPENRIYPFVYQRLWKSSINGDMQTSGTAQSVDLITSASANLATWSHSFNLISQDYSLSYDTSNNYLTGRGFSLASSYYDGTDKEDVIRLPKDGGTAGSRTYYYYNNIGDKISDRSASVNHTASSYRFGYEANTSLMKDYTTDETSRYKGRKIFSMPDNGDGSFTIHYSHDAAGDGKTEDGVFLVGNPMMSHLVISNFKEANSSVSSLTTWNKQSANTIVIIDGQPVGTTEDVTTIAPAHAFFVQSTQTNNVYPTTLDLTYSTSMFDPTATSGKAKRLSNDTNPFAALRILASADSVKAGTLLLQGRDNKAATILDSEVQPKVAVFTVSDGKSFDVQPVNGDIIPLGIIAKDSVTLSFQTIGNFDLSEWKLRDLTTGFSYDLDGPVKIAIDGTTIGRYILTRGNATNIDQRLSTDGVTLNVANGIATVTSDNDDITAVYSYDEGGSLVDQKLLNIARQATLHVAPGVDIVKVCRAGKADKTYKVMGR